MRVTPPPTLAPWGTVADVGLCNTLVADVLCAAAAIGLFVVSGKERSTFAHVAGTCVCIGLFVAAYLTIALTYSEKNR